MDLQEYARISDEDNEPEHYPKDYKEEQAKIIKTLLSPTTSSQFRTSSDFRTGPPTKYITIQPLYDSWCNLEWGLTVGSNYHHGTLKRDFITKLEEILETDEPIMWYVDPCAWQWYRLPSLPKPKGKQPPILQQARVALM